MLTLLDWLTNKSLHGGRYSCGDSARARLPAVALVCCYVLYYNNNYNNVRCGLDCDVKTLNRKYPHHSSLSRLCKLRVGLNRVCVALRARVLAFKCLLQVSSMFPQGFTGPFSFVVHALLIGDDRRLFTLFTRTFEASHSIFQHQPFQTVSVHNGLPKSISSHKRVMPFPATLIEAALALAFRAAFSGAFH